MGGGRGEEEEAEAEARRMMNEVWVRRDHEIAVSDHHHVSHHVTESSEEHPTSSTKEWKGSENGRRELGQANSIKHKNLRHDAADLKCQCSTRPSASNGGCHWITG